MAGHDDEIRPATQQLASALLDDVARITGRSVARMRERLATYARVPAEALFPVTLDHTRNLLESICDPEVGRRSADDHFRLLGETRLAQGVTVDDMLQAWQISLEVVLEEAHPLAEQWGASDAVLLEFVEATWRWGDIGMRASAAAHRAGEIRELARLAAEQSALRRVATLAARNAPPDQVFALVTEEVSRLIAVSSVRMVRFEQDGSVTILSTWGAAADGLDPGTHVVPPAGTVAHEILRTGTAARVDGVEQIGGPIGALMRREGAHSAAGGPIVVDGRPWGAIVVGAPQSLPAGTEDRVASFAELVSAAISNTESQAAVERLAAEQSALARVATLVARAPSPYDLFATLVEELGRLLNVDAAAILRDEGDATATVIAGWSSGPIRLPVGERLSLAGANLANEVLRTGISRRQEHYDDAPGPIAATVREHGFRCAVASPIVVADATWGVIAVLSRQRQPLAPDTEARVEEFTRQAGMALVNAKSRSDLAQSRARIVRAGDEARRRLERDLHDGAQQRLVSLGLHLRAAEATVPPQLRDLRHSLERLGSGLTEVLDDLRELSRGLHPAVLSEGGLGPALHMLARRSAVPVTLRIEVGTERFDQAIEVAAYFVAAEALTNTAKHARASRIDIDASSRGDWLEMVIRDDGRGGADASHGTGLTGLVDRVEAIGGAVEINSDRDLGTTIRVKLPVRSMRS